jgi:hypothetical protein
MRAIEVFQNVLNNNNNSSAAFCDFIFAALALMVLVFVVIMSLVYFTMIFDDVRHGKLHAGNFMDFDYSFDGFGFGYIGVWSLFLVLNGMIDHAMITIFLAMFLILGYMSLKFFKINININKESK